MDSIGTRYCPFCREVQITQIINDEIEGRKIRRTTIKCIACGRTLYIEVFPKKKIIIGRNNADTEQS